jgi:hypothetical protein
MYPYEIIIRKILFVQAESQTFSYLYLNKRKEKKAEKQNIIMKQIQIQKEIKVILSYYLRQEESIF